MESFLIQADDGETSDRRLLQNSAGSGEGGVMSRSGGEAQV